MKAEYISAGYLLPTLTDTEMGALSEAVRLAQQIHEESIGNLNPALSRIQRKLGEEPGT